MQPSQSGWPHSEGIPKRREQSRGEITNQARVWDTGSHRSTDPSEATTSSQGNTSTSTQLSVAQLTGLLESERAKTLKLHQEIALLQARVRELERTTPVSLGQQADLLVSKNNTLTACGLDSYEHFHDFSIDGMIDKLREQVPDIYAFFMHLGDVERNVSPGEVSSTQELKAVSSLCTLLNSHVNRVKGMQLLISMMLIARSTGRQVRALTHININSTYIQCKIIILTYICIYMYILVTNRYTFTCTRSFTVLNHAGICMSYMSTWTYLRQLTTQAWYTDVIQSGRWLWVYDNLNIHQRVRHERTGEGNNNCTG